MIYPINESSLETAARLLREGGIVAFPTETVYGLGADARNERAVEKIFALKQRPHYNPLIVHISSAAEIESVADLKSNSLAAARFERLTQLWPGPLSLILPKAAAISRRVTANLATVAVRVPNHPGASALLKEVGLPVAAPSANLFTTISPTTAQHVEEAFAGKVQIVLDGGPCAVGLESTILSVVGEKPELLRPGGITIDQLESALKEEVALKCYSKTSNTGIVAPGMLRVHYAPATPLIFRHSLAKQQLPRRTALISFSAVDVSTLEFDYAHIRVLSKAGDLQEVASRLFAALRDVDRLGMDLIVIDTCPEEGLGLAIMDRLKRAAAGHAPAEQAE